MTVFRPHAQQDNFPGTGSWVRRPGTRRIANYGKANVELTFISQSTTNEQALRVQLGAVLRCSSRPVGVGVDSRDAVDPWPQLHALPVIWDADFLYGPADAAGSNKSKR
jgi:hypothetical protein